MTPVSSVIMAMDTGEPEPLPIRIERVGRAVEFYTEAGGDGSSVRYDIRVVSQLGPPGANAFLLEDVRFADRGRSHLLRFVYFHIDRGGRKDPRSELA